MDENDLKRVTNEKNVLLFVKQFHQNFRSKPPRFQETKSIFRDAKWYFDASWGFKGLSHHWFNVSCSLGEISAEKTHLISGRVPGFRVQSELWPTERVANTKRRTNAVLMLGQRRRRWANINTALVSSHPLRTRQTQDAQTMIDYSKLWPSERTRRWNNAGLAFPGYVATIYRSLHLTL